MDEAQVIHAAGQIRQQIAHPRTALPVLTKRVNTLHQPTGLTKKTEILTASFQLGAVEAFQFGFVVEGVEVAHPTAAKHLDDALGSRPVVQLPSE